MEVPFSRTIKKLRPLWDWGEWKWNLTYPDSSAGAASTSNHDPQNALVLRSSSDALPLSAPLVTTRKSPGFTKFASVGSIPAKPSKSSQYETPPAQFDATPELLELEDEELLELELEDELLELDDEDELLDDELEELLEEDELELLVPDEPVPPPQAESSNTTLIKMRDCFIMATTLSRGFIGAHKRALRPAIL